MVNRSESVDQRLGLEEVVRFTIIMPLAWYHSMISIVIRCKKCNVLALLQLNCHAITTHNKQPTSPSSSLYFVCTIIKRKKIHEVFVSDYLMIVAKFTTATTDRNNNYSLYIFVILLLLYYYLIICVLHYIIINKIKLW